MKWNWTRVLVVWLAVLLMYVYMHFVYVRSGTLAGTVDKERIEEVDWKRFRCVSCSFCLFIYFFMRFYIGPRRHRCTVCSLLPHALAACVSLRRSIVGNVASNFQENKVRVP